MEEKLKVSYEQIKKANEEIETIKLGAKGYAQVNERIKAFRKVYPTGTIETIIASNNTDNRVKKHRAHKTFEKISETFSLFFLF